MRNKEKMREKAKKLNPIDDLMFRKMAEEKEFCEEILRVIMADLELIVLEWTPQWSGTNLQGRSVVVDLKCVDGNNKHINVEVHNSDNDDHQRRVRYNGAILTANITDTGTLFEKVPDVCVIFISRFDIFKRNHPVYHVKRVIEETGDFVYNGFEEIYVNAAVDDGSDISELMKVFVDDDAYSNKFPETSRIKRKYKENEEALNNMSSIMEDLMEEGRAEGRTEGIRSTLYALVYDGMLTVEQALTKTDMSEKEFIDNMKTIYGNA